MKKRIVDLQEYRQKQSLKKQLAELDAMADLYMSEEQDPVVRKGYKNFMRFIKILDARYNESGGEK